MILCDSQPQFPRMSLRKPTTSIHFKHSDFRNRFYGLVKFFHFHVSSVANILEDDIPRC